MAGNNTYITYFGDNQTDTFGIPFRYNKKSEVVVLVNSVDVSNLITFLNDQTIKFNSPPKTGDVITVKRVTDIFTPEIVWKNGSNTTSAQLNIMVRQLINGLQEARDTAERGIFADVDGTFDFNNYRIKNLGNPINPKDAATKQWVETANTSSVTQAREAAQQAQSSANTAQAHRNSASASATSASTSATSASTSASNANASKVSAENAKLAAEAAQTAAETARDEAVAARRTSQDASSTATNAANSAAASATAAENSKVAAATYAANAMASENAAKQYAEQTLTLVEGEGYLTQAGNLAGLADVAEARANLGLRTAATMNGTTFNFRANNLSDVADKAVARTNLGLGTAAVQSDSRYLKTAGNLSDVADKAEARTNLGLGQAATRSDAFFLQTSKNLAEISSTAAKAEARANLGLGNVNNTADVDKPISTAVQTALNGKANSSHTHSIGQISGLQGALDAKATTTQVNDRVSRVGVQEYIEQFVPVGEWGVAANEGLFVVGIKRMGPVNHGSAESIALRRIVQHVPSQGGWVWINRN